MIILLIHFILAGALTFGLFSLIETSPGFWQVAILVGLSIGSLIIIAVLMTLFFILVFLISGKKNPKCMIKHGLMNYYSRYVFNIIMRVKLKVIGKENIPNHANFVVYSNHIEYSDPVYLKQVFHKYPVAFISKEVLWENKLIAMVLSGIGCIPISPGADRTALNSIVEGIKLVKSGQPMGIFPEGKRTYSHNMIPFKPGSFKLATKAEADIVPVCLYNMHEVYRKGRIKIAKVTLVVLPAIKASEYQGLDTQVVADRVYTLINDCLKELSVSQLT